MNDKREPRACTYCGHVYITTCDGREDCPNRIWLDTHRARMEFIALCEKHTVAPGVAMENDAIRNALGVNDVAEVERILKEEF